MSLKSEQVDDLIARGKDLIGGKMTIRNKEFKFLNIGSAELCSGKGEPERYTITGNLISEDGDMLQNPLKKIVAALEKKKLK